MYKDILNAWWTMYLPWSTMVQYSVLLNIPQLLVYFTNIQSEVYHWLTHTLSVSFQVVMSYHSDGCESTLLQLLQEYYNPSHTCAYYNIYYTGICYRFNNIYQYNEILCFKIVLKLQSPKLLNSQKIYKKCLFYLHSDVFSMFISNNLQLYNSMLLVTKRLKFYQ